MRESFSPADFLFMTGNNERENNETPENTSFCLIVFCNILFETT